MSTSLTELLQRHGWELLGRRRSEPSSAAVPYQVWPKDRAGEALNGHYLSSREGGRLGGSGARRSTIGLRVACPTWRAALAGATFGRLSEILPGARSLRALGRRRRRRHRWLRFQLDGREILVPVATLRQA